jgi:Mn2+/Fe2+ NRAMP family transporter
VWLPVVMIFVLLLVNRPELMGKYVNGKAFNILAWALSIAMIVLTMLFSGSWSRWHRLRRQLPPIRW